MKPWIISAAVRFPYEGREVVWPLHRHCDFFDIVKQINLKYDKNAVEQGFISYDGKEERFVDRVEAMKIAIEAQQVPPKPEMVAGNALYSEDLW